MWRLVLAAIVAGGLAFAWSTPAAALDRDEVVVPSEFRMAAPAAPSLIPAEDTTVRFRLALEDVAPVASSVEAASVSRLYTGMPGLLRVIPGDQWR
jgi:hypothetical protein